MKSKVLLVGFICLVFVIGIVLSSCSELCSISNQCTVTIMRVSGSNASGGIDNSRPRRSCGLSECIVTQVIQNPIGRTGTFRCSC